jgi:hypothetical protein
MNQHAKNPFIQPRYALLHNEVASETVHSWESSPTVVQAAFAFQNPPVFVFVVAPSSPARGATTAC